MDQNCICRNQKTILKSIKKKTLQIWPLKSRTDYDGRKKRFYERKVHINEDDKLIYRFRDNKLSPI